MGEKMGFLSVLALVFLFVIPFTLNLYDKQVKANRLMSLSNEVRQMVIAEGGVTPVVSAVKDDFSKIGIDIQFKDDEGSVVEGPVEAGEKVNIYLEYEDFKIDSNALVTKRRE